MAEGFARTYGGDVMIAASAGLSPAMNVARDTRSAMSEKDIDLRDHFPKAIRNLGRAQFDLVVNMSGSEILPDEVPGAKVIEWDVEDPVYMKYEDHCKIRDLIETLVVKLVLDLRKAADDEPRFRGQGSGRLEL
jgi:protein-tyrosine-phosphatase